MNKKFKPASVLLSVLLSVVLVFTATATILLSTSREYLNSSKFATQIDNTDLSSLTFIYNGEKITLENYVKDYVSTSIDNHVLDKASPFYSDLWFPFADALTDFTVDKVFSSEYVNRLVKDEFKDIFNYFLHSSVTEAKQRIKDGVTLDENPQLNPENASGYEEKISAQVKLAVLKSIEEETGTGCDKIIVLMSEKTVSTFKTISIILGLLLLLLNIKKFLNVFVYLGVVFCGCGGIITYIQNSFESHFAGMTDLITYEFLKPVVEAYSQYADKGITYGIICIVIFAALTVAFCVIKKNKQ
jgi:hypothetical protein